MLCSPIMDRIKVQEFRGDAKYQRASALALEMAPSVYAIIDTEKWVFFRLRSAATVKRLPPQFRLMPDYADLIGKHIVNLDNGRTSQWRVCRFRQSSVLGGA